MTSLASSAGCCPSKIPIIFNLPEWHCGQQGCFGPPGPAGRSFAPRRPAPRIRLSARAGASQAAARVKYRSFLICLNGTAVSRVVSVRQDRRAAASPGEGPLLASRRSARAGASQAAARIKYRSFLIAPEQTRLSAGVFRAVRTGNPLPPPRRRAAPSRRRPLRSAAGLPFSNAVHCSVAGMFCEGIDLARGRRAAASGGEGPQLLHVASGLRRLQPESEHTPKHVR